MLQDGSMRTVTGRVSGPPARVPLLLLVVALVLALGACGSSGDDGAGGSTDAAADASVDDGSTDDATSTDDAASSGACGLIDIGDLEAAFGASGEIDYEDETNCFVDYGPNVLKVYPHLDAADFVFDNEDLAGGTTVDGLGDEAVYVAENQVLAVRVGGDAVVVQITETDLDAASIEDVLVQAGETAADRLG